MKKLLLLLIVLPAITLTAQFNKGVNLSEWFQAGSPKAIQFNKYTVKDFENIKSLGADVIRLPINLNNYTLGAPDYEIDPFFLNFLSKAVDWCEQLGIHLLLDNHTFDPAVATDPNIDDILIPVWRNMAEHFKDRSELIYYEILNEPHGIDDTIWYRIQGDVIDAIREVDTVHTIVVGQASFGGFDKLYEIPEYDDDNLLYTFHFYDPFLFTHQGASWSDPSMAPLAGVPFPYDADEMPEVPDELEGTWIANSLLYDYKNSGTVSSVRSRLDVAIQFKEDRNVPLFCGEFGVYIPNSNNNDRIFWYHVVRTYLEAHDIPWTSWDYHGGFGLFEANSAGMFEHDLNTHLLSALGFNIPPQTDYQLKPDSSGFIIFSDYIGQSIINSSSSSGELNFFSNETAAGEYSIKWINPSQYNHIGFNFNPTKDLSYLASNGYAIGFWLKSSNPSAKFDIRFIDSKKDADEHPWRNRYTIDNTNTVLDGNWVYVQIPLTDFYEHGSWDNDTWYQPQGLFEWNEINRFEIVNEHGQLSNTTLEIDEIEIFDPNAVSVVNENLPDDFILLRNYPNPFNPETIIQYNLPVSLDHNNIGLIKVNLTIYDALGRIIDNPVNTYQKPGFYKIKWKAVNLSSGFYFYTLNYNGNLITKKMLLLK